MDLSKLPRLSRTDPPPPPDPVDVDPSPPPPGGFEPVMTTPAPVAGFCRCGAPLRVGARFCDSCGAPVAGVSDISSQRDFAVHNAGVSAGVGAEVWLSAVLGAFLIYNGRSFGGWLIATATGRAYETGVLWKTDDRMDQPVEYWDLQGFTALSDSAIFLFGLAMVLEAVVLALVGTRFRQKSALVTVALLVTVAVTAYNLVVGVKLLAAGVMPLMSLLAVAFGGYIAMFEWRLLQRIRLESRPE